MRDTKKPTHDDAEGSHDAVIQEYCEPKIWPCMQQNKPSNGKCFPAHRGILQKHNVKTRHVELQPLNTCKYSTR